MRQELQVPGMLVDAMVKDAALTLTHQQYLALINIGTALTTINISR